MENGNRNQSSASEEPAAGHHDQPGARQVEPAGEAASIAGIVVRGIVLGLLVVAIAAVWQTSAMRDAVDPPRLLAWVHHLHGEPRFMLLAVAGFIVGSMLAVPVNVMVLASVLGFGGLAGAVVALVGSMTSAAVTFLGGRWLGRSLLERLGGGRVRRVSRRLADGGVATVALVRMMPVAPFMVVNVVAGASQVRFRDFLAGTLIGLLPGVVVLALFGNQLAAALVRKSPLAIALVGVAGVALTLIAAWLRSLLRTRSAPRSTPP